MDMDEAVMTIKEEIETAGYCVLRNVIDVDAVKRLQNDIMHLMAASDSVS